MLKKSSNSDIIRKNKSNNGGFHLLNLYLSMLDTQEDKDLFEKIYTECKQAMFYTANKILHNSYDAEDAVSQSFLSLADNFSPVPLMNPTEIKRYVIIICRNKALNIYNKNKNNAENLVRLTDTNAVDNGFFDKCEKSNLIMAVDKLPNVSKDILYLSIVYERSTDEISQILGLSAEAVWKRVSRAKAQLKENLERNEYKV